AIEIGVAVCQRGDGFHDPSPSDGKFAEAHQRYAGWNIGRILFEPGAILRAANPGYRDTFPGFTELHLQADTVTTPPLCFHLRIEFVFLPVRHFPVPFTHNVDIALKYTSQSCLGEALM